MGLGSNTSRPTPITPFFQQGSKSSKIPQPPPNSVSSFNQRLKYISLHGTSPAQTTTGTHKYTPPPAQFPGQLKRKPGSPRKPSASQIWPCSISPPTILSIALNWCTWRDSHHPVVPRDVCPEANITTLASAETSSGSKPSTKPSGEMRGKARR